MRMLLVVLSLFGFLLSPGGIDPVAARPGDWPAVTVNGYPGVVAPRDEAEGMVRSEDAVTGYWLPDERWLTRAEDAVVREAADITDEDRQPRIGGYRQYAGYITNGERKIFINSMCTEFDGWRSNGILVMDGGPCFWNAVYNVDTDEIELLIVNGQA